MTDRTKHETRPCKHCGQPVVFASVHAADGTMRVVTMDPSLPVYTRIVDPDREPRGAFWLEDAPPGKGECRQSLAAHRCPPLRAAAAKPAPAPEEDTW